MLKNGLEEGFRTIWNLVKPPKLLAQVQAAESCLYHWLLTYFPELLFQLAPTANSPRHLANIACKYLTSINLYHFNLQEELIQAYLLSIISVFQVIYFCILGTIVDVAVRINIFINYSESFDLLYRFRTIKSTRPSHVSTGIACQRLKFTSTSCFWITFSSRKSSTSPAFGNWIWKLVSLYVTNKLIKKKSHLISSRKFANI